MKKFSYTIQDPEGIHARPAGLLVQEAKKYEDCSITIQKDSRVADAKRLLQVMGLGIKCNNTVEVMVEGNKEEDTAKALEQFLKQNL